MKGKKLLLAFIFVSFFILSSSTYVSSKAGKAVPSSGHIFLYGETHGSEKVLNKEFELWSGYYNSKGMRHLFVEYPYYTAEFLNIWMKSDNDDILDAIYDDWDGTQAQAPAVKEFFKKIKKECPETIFHGTDVGHQYNTTGERYLSYLKDNNMKASDEYAAALEAIKQGKRFYKNGKIDFIYREDKLAENFIREFDKLNGESVMGIYGSAHIPLDGMAYMSNNHPGMANQLKKRYGEKIQSEDISWLALDIEPIKTETIIASGKNM